VKRTPVSAVVAAATPRLEPSAAGRARVVRCLVEDMHVSEERAERLAVAWERLAEIGGISPSEPGLWIEAEGWLIAAAQMDPGEDRLR